MSNSAAPGMSLNARQARFVEEYLTDLNATQAAIRAGYSEKTAYSQGQRLLKNVEVQKHITVAQADRSERTGVTQDYVLGIIDEAISLSRDTDNVMGFYKGAELLGKHLGMFTDRVDLMSTDGSMRMPSIIQFVAPEISDESDD